MTPIASTPETRRRDEALARELDLNVDYDLPPPVCDTCGAAAGRYMRFGVGTGNTFNLCRPCLVAAIAELDGAP